MSTVKFEHEHLKKNFICYDMLTTCLLIYRGLDFSRPWHETFLENREFIRENLHLLHPSHQTILNMCQTTLGSMILVDCSEYRWASFQLMVCR